MIVFIYLSMLVCICASKPEYYWKEFYGEIPLDAFPGGTDGGGNPTYIGQTFFPQKNYILPTIIEKGNKFAYVGVDNTKLQSELHTKILCSDNNTLFKWVPTSTKKMRYLTGCKQIYGGVVGGALLTIGRANHLGRTITGRVADSAAHKWHGLYIHDLAFKENHLTEFEILTFDCHNPWIEELLGQETR